MEVIRFDGYTVEEKVAIARDYLWPRQRERNGLLEDEVSVADDVLRTVVQEYTREAGVRNLERELGTVLRKTATKIASAQSEPPIEVTLATLRDALGRQKHFQESAVRTAVPGVATGLAVTGVGGDVLFIEATRMKGKDGLVLTGPARGRHEGVGADRALLRPRPRRRARHRPRRSSRARSSTSTSRRAPSPRTGRARA
jgi:ATP-dependent Lon protease